MTAPSQEYQPLSHALQPPAARQIVNQNQQSDLPRLQLAPPEHQKHLQAQAQARQQQEVQQQEPSTSPTAQRSSDEHATSISSSREVSPAVGVETSQPSTAHKRKSGLPKDTNSASKKRKTDPPQEEVRETPLQYGLGTHYPYAYAYPGAPPPPPLPAFHPAASNPSAGPSMEMSFNEFQWRMLNLCGEFYEAATELIRSTPHHVLSQAFQLLGRGTGVDPISVLNDARRTCDILLTNPQALASPPPPPTGLSLPVLTSLAHLNSRASVGPGPSAAGAPSSYYPSPMHQSAPVAGEMSSSKGKEKDRAPNNVQGTWKDHEVQRLKELAEKHRVRDKVVTAEEREEEEEEETAENAEGEDSTKIPKTVKTKDGGEIDWDKVVAEFGDERSRHQVLIKATYLGLKPSSSLPGKKPKRKRASITSADPPPPTFSSTSAKSIPSGYSPSQLGTVQSPSATPSVTAVTPTIAAAQPKPASVPHSANTATSIGAQKPSSAAISPLVSQLHQPQHPHAHVPYPQTGWYPHPQNPYYAYHHPMYYPHPQGYSMQGYGMQSPQGYYGQPYAPPPPTAAESVSQAPPEKQKGKRKTTGTDSGPASGNSRVTPVPPPSLPTKSSPADPSSAKAAASSSKAKSDRAASTSSTPQAPPVTSSAAPTTTGSSGILRRGPNNSLFTYTPLPHGPGGSTTTPTTSTAIVEQVKEV